MLISTGSNGGSHSNMSFNSKAISTTKSYVAELPSPPLSPQEDCSFRNACPVIPVKDKDLVEQGSTHESFHDIDPYLDVDWNDEGQNDENDTDEDVVVVNDDVDVDDVVVDDIDVDKDVQTNEYSKEVRYDRKDDDINLLPHSIDQEQQPQQPSQQQDHLHHHRHQLQQGQGQELSDLPEVIMPRRDWVQLQARINFLETEVTRSAETNQELKQELDKVNEYLFKLTKEGGDGGDEGWKKGYEFLVQQIDLMHRQLQQAYSQMNQMSRQGQGQGQGQYPQTCEHRNHSTDLNGLDQQEEHHCNQNQEINVQPDIDMTRQLRAEVDELTSSLRTWKAAFHQAEENYRRKCEGERVLKQIIREREAQLLDLAEKLTGHKQSLSFSSSPSSSLSSLPLDFNYPELLRLSKAKMTDRASTPFDSVDEQFQEGDDGSKPMPGVFPVEVADGSSSHIPIQVQVQNYQCSYISILFWAASLIAVNLLP